MHAEFDAQKTAGTADLFLEQGGKGNPAPDPIFILGLPRAGSTLIEQILASHPDVDGTLELPNILSLAHRLRGRKQLTDRQRYPRILHELAADELKTLGEDYIENTRIHRQGAPFFTDKMPNNFRHIGLIHLILPNAKIIDARRNPMDCCWSGFKQLFAEGQEFTYSLYDIGNYYRGYCGLPFDPACIDFHKTERAVRTASSEQVRRPLNKSGLEQWRQYEAHLAPLKAALGPGLAPQ
jgi:hypothetical protein